MQVSLNYLSELTGIDRRRVTRLLSDLPSQPGPNNSKTVDSILAIRVLYAGADGDGRLDASQERAALDKVRRELAELDLARRRHELIPVEEVAAAWTENVGIAKGRLLGLPSRVSGDMLRLKTQRDIEQRLKDAVIEILEELSTGAASTPG